MLLLEHDRIVKAALQAVGGAGLDAEQTAALMVGNQYPDRPCAKRALDADSGRIVMQDYRLCPLLSLLRRLRPGRKGSSRDQFAEAYASHKHLLAIFHCMTPAPELKTRDVVEQIVQYARTFCYLSIDDVTSRGSRSSRPNAFWLGIVCHMIVDAFSASHVTRVCHLPRRTVAGTIKAMRNLQDAGIRPHSMVDDFSAELVMKTLYSRRKELATALRHVSDPGPTVRAFMAKHVPVYDFDGLSDRSRRRLLQYALAICMYEQVLSATPDLRMKRRKQEFPSKTKTKTKRLTTHDTDYRIVNFGYYAAQNAAVHAGKDVMAYYRFKVGTSYTATIRANVAHLLDAYARAVRDVEIGLHGETKRRAVEFADEVSAWLRRDVFEVHAQCRDLCTGFEVDTVRREFGKGVAN